MIDYEEFVAAKLLPSMPTGFEPAGEDWPHLFAFQRDIVGWALRRGRAAVFAATGLGKTRMQLTWAEEVRRYANANVLVLAPLAVARQTIAEGEGIGIKVTHARNGQRDARPGINIANYEQAEKFDPKRFGAIVLDESSAIKHYDTRTLATLLDMFGSTPYKLACTATPAPNDWLELGTHAEFLGACSRREMMSEFFVQDRSYTKQWNLKGHARSAFWAWVASWGALVQSPVDLGHDGSAYELPPLEIREHVLEVAKPAEGCLFAMAAESLMDRRRARKASVDLRAEKCAEIVAREPDEPWILWCDLNAESEALTRAIPGAVEVTGSMPSAQKERALLDFSEGRARVLVTKPSIAGFGLNWQHCARAVFVGLSDSWESYHQAVRRCWRFGQTRSVEVHIVVTDEEGSVLANIRRKDAAAQELAQALAAETAGAVQAAVCGLRKTRNTYTPTLRMESPQWLKTEA